MPLCDCKSKSDRQSSRAYLTFLRLCNLVQERARRERRSETDRKLSKRRPPDRQAGRQAGRRPGGREGPKRGTAKVSLETFGVVRVRSPLPLGISGVTDDTGRAAAPSGGELPFGAQVRLLLSEDMMPPYEQFSILPLSVSLALKLLKKK